MNTAMILSTWSMSDQICRVMWLQMVAPEPRFLVPEPILLALLARSEYGRQQAWPEVGEEDTKECTKPRGKRVLRSK